MVENSTKSTYPQHELLQWLGELVKACGNQTFPTALQGLFEHFCDTSEFSILTFRKDAVPVPVFSSIRKYDKDLMRYCSGLYLLDPYYDAYSRRDFTGFARMDEIGSLNMEDILKPYWNYMSDWGTWDEVGYVFAVSENTSLHFSFARTQGEPRFEPSAIEFFRDMHLFLEPLVALHWEDIDSNMKGQELVWQRLHEQVKSILQDFGSSVLTQREREVVQAMLKGHSAKSIARLLTISPGTVGVHRSNIYEKLDVSSNSELFSLLIDAMISVEPSKGQDILVNYMGKPAD